MITTISEPNKPGGSRRSVSLEHGDPDVHGRNASSTRCEARQLPPITPEERADRILWDAEAAKAHIITTPGKNSFHNNDYIQSFMIDDEYMLVGAHVDEATYNKIIEGKYVDFGKLIPHDRIAVEEDQRLEMIIRGGKTYWVPATETTSISNVIKWEQAFRVYSNIYTK